MPVTAYMSRIANRLSVMTTVAISLVMFAVTPRTLV